MWGARSHRRDPLEEQRVAVLELMRMGMLTDAHSGWRAIKVRAQRGSAADQRVVQRVMAIQRMRTQFRGW